MNGLINLIRNLHDGVFNFITRITEGWFLGLFARFTFVAVLYGYYFNSALTKVNVDEGGILGFFQITDGAYFQIVLPAVEAAGFDPSAVAFFPHGLIVFLGTYAEFILPALIVIGLFSRVAAAGMIGFIIVQSLTDVFVHNIGAESTGALFDRFPDSLILDQRLLWIFVLAVIVLKGAGKVSVDHLLSKRMSA